MGIVPSTNPTSTTIFKSIIAVKSGNAIVFSPHPSAAKCTLKAAELMRDAAVEAGAPEDIIGCITMPTMGATNELMKCKEVNLIIATGGPGMVKAAYSAGKPALGVGAGNSPAYIERTADIKQAVSNIMASKTFDSVSYTHLLRRCDVQLRPGCRMVGSRHLHRLHGRHQKAGI